MATYSTDDDGKFIPSTQRPDGTWRKARRVKEGYVPQEEVPLYESKGKQFAQRKTGLPPGMCPLLAEAAKKEREKQERLMAKKQEKLSAASNHVGATSKKQPKAQPGVLVLPPKLAAASKATQPNAKTKLQAKNNDASNAQGKHSKAVDDLPQISSLNLAETELLDLGKQLKKLRKKMREIEAIEEKIKSGELKKPEQDQLDKVKRKKSILQEIKQLEMQLPPENSV